MTSPAAIIAPYGTGPYPWTSLFSRAHGDRRMRLTRIEWIGYRIPFKNRFVAADVNAEYRHGLLLSLKTDGGTVGFGEASPVGAGDPRAVAALAEELRSLAPQIGRASCRERG